MAPLRPRLESVYRREGSLFLIEMKLQETRQLFNTLDPAPFIEKDLDDDAEAYIIDAAREIGPRRPKKVVVHLPAAAVSGDIARQLPVAMHTYFTYRAEHAALQLRHTLREGSIALLIGLSFLATCLMLREAANQLPWSSARTIVREGLLIMGWVAMWRPIQTFLYDWWPIRHHRILLSELSSAPIEVRPH